MEDGKKRGRDSSQILLEELGETNTVLLWQHIYGDVAGLLGLFSGLRRLGAGSKKLDEPRTAYFGWPKEREQACAWALHEAAAGREVYHCAHLLKARRRVKVNAAPLLACYVDADGAKPQPGMPKPTALVASSPHREQLYWLLTRPVPPELGERLNLRLAYAMGADSSGWDLTQLLRPPGTRNHKYPDAPLVRVLEFTDERHDPDDLDRLLPSASREHPQKTTYAPRPRNVVEPPGLSRLSRRMQGLIRHGNGSEYESRSEADFAACVAMFGAGFSEAEVWAAMTDPTNGISEKFFEKGRDGERYLELTTGKARAVAKSGRHRVYVGPPESDPATRRRVVIRVG